MIKLLVHADYCCMTGFGNVARNIAANLQAGGDFEIDVVGINYDGDPYDTSIWPGKVYPALKGALSSSAQYNDVFGRQRVLDLLATNEYDVLFILQDTFVVKDYINALIETCQNVGTRIVYYYPIDATPEPSWITDVVSRVDYPITFTEYARRESLEVDPNLKLDVIYHGTNTSEYYPLDNKAALKQKLFGYDRASHFVIMNINRNQPRKDVLRSLLVLKELKDRGRNPLLYLHMSGNDVGGEIGKWADQLGLEWSKDYLFPMTIGSGYPTELVNQLYNAVDCVLTTTHGEGWGLSITEAMATKIPIIAPDVTSISEILADNRGLLIPSGKTNHDWYTVGHQDNNRLRPLMDVQAAATAVEHIMDGVLPDIEAAYNWATTQDWAVITKRFEAIIRKAAANKRTPRPAVANLNRQQRRKLARVK